MARDELNDYEELLKSFESRKTETASKNNGSQKSGFSSTKTDFGDYESGRRKKVQDFKIDLDTEASTDKPNLKGGVYFSNPPKDIGEHAQREKEAAAGVNIKQGTDKFTVSTPPTTYAQKKAIAKKKAKAKKKAERAKQYSEKIKGKKGEAFLALFSSENLSKNILNLAIIILVSVILCVYGIGCINDVLALNGDDKTVEVIVSNNMTDSEVIDILEKQGLIRNKLFCKLFIKVLDKGGAYVSGEYTLNENMGIEKMLATMKADITLSETITLTFPEGWTIDQIAEKLETNDVCRASD
ncbi:MAG: endolytic transglycosylase MltG, partial [Oscillospiraceae bacterium]|nr:endolytic transglycosylase MltG [Oscillospiraceae bacterium]